MVMQGYMICLIKPIKFPNRNHMIYFAGHWRGYSRRNAEMEADDIISSAIEKCTADDNRNKYELALESKRDCVQAKLEIVLCSTPKTSVRREASYAF